ncbi:hypothetical protein ACHQM5_030568 [Ranunculus cassubicifolius]
MRFSSPSSSLQFITIAKMSSSRAHYRGRNQWRRGLSDRPNTAGDGPNFRSVNYASRQVDGPTCQNSGHRHQQPPPRPSQFQYQQRQPPPLNQGLPRRLIRPSNYKPPDYRNWECALSQPPSECERFVVLSYNILADYLAINHRHELYWHIPHHILGWEWRKRKILFELGLWSPDIMSLQEVDRFQDLEEELKLHGYSGIWKMRTGIPVDGCAIFWRTTRFTLLYEESIEFNRLGLRDNVAQICVLENQIASHLYKCPKGRPRFFSVRVPDTLPSDSVVGIVYISANEASIPPHINCVSLPYLFLLDVFLGTICPFVYYLATYPTLYCQTRNDMMRICSSNDANRLVICNIHMLYNPRRGEMKLGQVRALLEKAYAVSKLWDNAPVVICGDFNCTPKSSLYNFISEQKLDLTGLARDHISGQSSAEIKPQRLYTPPRHGSIRDQTPNNSLQEPTIADEKKEACLKADNCIPDMHGHNKPNTDGETKLQSQISTSMVDNEIADESAKEVENEIIDTLKNGVSSVTGDIHPFELGNDTDQDLTTSVTKSENCDSVMVGNGHGDQSNGCTDQSIHYVLPDNSQANLHTSSLIVSTTQVMSVHDGMGKETTHFKDDITSSESNLSCKDSRPDKTVENALNQESLSELVPDTSFSDDKNVSISANLEDSSLEEDGSIGEAHTSCETDEYLEKQTMFPSDKIQESTSLLVEANTYDPSSWTPMEIETATGNAECTLVEHPLKLRSTYTEVEDHSGTRDSSREPQVTSYHRKFMGTVDYIWRSEGLQTVKVLDTIPKHALQWTPGFPTPKWGSDHIALVSQLAFTKGMDKETM